MRAALILAGGYGSRFGDEDKAVARIDGEPMVGRVLSRVAPLVDDVVLNVRDDQRARMDAALGGERIDSYAVDPTPDRGPLAGIATGLARVSADRTLVVACDMPFVDPRLVRRLFDLTAGRDGAVPTVRTVDGRVLQPLQAVYRSASLERVARRALESGVASPVEALRDLAYVTVDLPADADDPGGPLFNVNTPSDRRAAERVLATRSN
ncbi:MAG: molybdenum cofactor guanylyltransferase [Halanaeroarchaeum sp.]